MKLINVISIIKKLLQKAIIDNKPCKITLEINIANGGIGKMYHLKTHKKEIK